MTRMNTLLLAATAALAFSFSAAQAQDKPVSVDDLFAISARNCETNVRLACTTITKLSIDISLKDFISIFRRHNAMRATVEATIRANEGWEGVITGETILQHGGVYTFSVASR